MTAEIEHRLCCPGKELWRVWRGTIADPNELAAERDRLRACHSGDAVMQLVGRRTGYLIREGLPPGSRAGSRGNEAQHKYTSRS